MNLRTSEILRYLGISGEGDPGTMELLQQSLLWMEEDSNPKHVMERVPLSFGPGEDRVVLGGTEFISRNLAGNLRRCEAAYIFVATLGLRVDHRMKRLMALSMAQAVVYQAVAATAIEAYCDEINEELRREAEAEGCFLKPRYSPGYGDLSLEYQRILLNRLQASKRIGVTLTDSLMMIPTKSVSAILGITKVPSIGTENKCDCCENAECEYRSKG